MSRNTFRFTRSLCCCFLIFAYSACSRPETASTTPSTVTSPTSNASKEPELTNASGVAPAEIIGVSAPPVEVDAGGAVESLVKVAVADGFHINANPPSQPYLRATQLRVESNSTGAGITTDAPVYPKAVVKRFSFSDEPLAVYQGEVTVRLPVRASSNAAKGAHTLRAELQTQACDDQQCYPPRTTEITVPVTVR